MEDEAILCLAKFGPENQKRLMLYEFDSCRAGDNNHDLGIFAVSSPLPINSTIFSRFSSLIAPGIALTWIIDYN